MEILYVEDNPVLRLLMDQILKSFGYKTKLVSNGCDAIKAAEEKFFDVILMDFCLPKMDGMEVSKIITEKKPEKKPKIILMTGYSVEPEKLDSFGIDDYLEKPATMEDLKKVLLKWENMINYN